jgi:hypothetical protein
MSVCKGLSKDRNTGVLYPIGRESFLGTHGPSSG